MFAAVDATIIPTVIKYLAQNQPLATYASEKGALTDASYHGTIDTNAAATDM